MTRKTKAPANADAQAKADAGVAGMAAGLGDMFKSMSLQNLPTIPANAFTELQAEYLKQATALWNSSLHIGNAEPTKPLADRRFANPAWSANPASACQVTPNFITTSTDKIAVMISTSG